MRRGTRLLEIAAAVSAVALLLAAVEFVRSKQERLAPVLPASPLTPAPPPAGLMQPSHVPKPVADPKAERARAVRAYEQGRVDEALACFQRLASSGDPVGKFMVDLILRRRAGRIP